MKMQKLKILLKYSSRISNITELSEDIQWTIVDTFRVRKNDQNKPKQTKTM